MHSLFLVFLMLLLTAVADTQVRAAHFSIIVKALKCNCTRIQLGGEVRNQNRRGWSIHLFRVIFKNVLRFFVVVVVVVFCLYSAQ